MKATSKKDPKGNINNRGKSREYLENLRIQAVKLYVKGGMKVEDIVEIMWMGESTLRYWIGVYRKKWRRWLKSKRGKTGRKPKKKNNLTSKEKKILKAVVLKEPRETKKLMLDFGLWTVKAIQHAIKVLFNKDLKERKVRKILQEMGMTNQKPLFRAYQQDPEKVEKRLDEELPFILDEAEKEKRTIYYWDEAWFKSANHRGRTRWEKGKTPIVTATWARFGVNAISIISPKWELRFMAYESSFTSDTLLSFLRKLKKGTKKKMTLILDGHPTHKTKKVKSYLESIDHQIKIYYLPWYSPELNPDEQVRLHVHNDLKGVIVANKKDLIAKVRQSLYRQQKQKDKVKSYFRHPDVQRSSD